MKTNNDLPGVGIMTLYIRHAALAAPITLVLATPAFAQTRHFDIAAQPAASGVAQFGMQAGLQIVAPPRG